MYYVIHTHTHTHTHTSIYVRTYIHTYVYTYPQLALLALRSTQRAVLALLALIQRHAPSTARISRLQRELKTLQRELS